MTIYDELGLTPDATDEQIRQAHRQLVKLLHPDLQQDPELRKIAQLQLMRINRMVEQLLHSSRSSVVVSSELPRITGTTLPQALSVSAVHRAWQKRERAWKQIALLSCGVAAVALLAFALPEPPIRSQATVPPPVSTTTAKTPRNDASESANVRVPRVAVGDSAQRTSARESSQEMPDVELPLADRPGAQGSGGSVGQDAPPLVADEAEELTPAPTVATAKPAPPKQDLHGVWLYAGDPGPVAPSKLYPPEYIELRLTQEPDGTLSGEYRGRYAVTDLAISPSIAFRFREKNPNLSAVVWSGARGSSGTVSLQLVRPDLLQVVWKTTTSASAQAEGGTQLSYGAATLIRRR